jgi:subtilisin family serine protease
MPRLAKLRSIALPASILLLLSSAGASQPVAGGGRGPDRPAWAGKLDPFLRHVALGSTRTQGVFGESLPPGAPAVLKALPPFVRFERGRVGAAAGEPIFYVKAGVVDGGPGGGPGGGALDAELARSLRDLGVEVRARVGTVASLAVPVSALGSVAGLPQISWLKAAHSYSTRNNVSTSSAFVGSRDANATFGTKGAGVIVAVIDTGIAYTNPDFRKSDGTSRILGIWDQTVTDAAHPPPAGFTFGAFYSKSDIDSSITSGVPLMTSDGFGHGSHVTGSAAGNGLLTGNGLPAGTFAGVAPEADIMAVRVFDTQGNFCTACDLTAAVQFVQGFARAAGEPWVGNMSLGSDLGAHDGSDPDEMTIDSLVGAGNPAQVAIAAGNSGAAPIHWDGTLTTGATLTNSFPVPSYTPAPGADSNFVWLDIWYKGSDKATVTVVSPGGVTVSASTGTDSGTVCSPSGAIDVIAVNAPDAINGDNEVFVEIWNSSACSPVIAPQVGTWTIKIHGDSIAPGAGQFDLWDEADLGGAIASVTLATHDSPKTVEIPGTSRNALTAGSFVDKNQWINVRGSTTTAGVSAPVGVISSFSGIGPTRDGRIKPDVAAPGEMIGSTLAGSLLATLTFPFIEQDGQHGDIRGTSMATPHVAGTAALLFAINPGLDGALVKAAITQGAQADANTGTVPNPQYGNGKLRAPGPGFLAASIVTNLAATDRSGSFAGTGSPFVDSYNAYKGTIPGISSTSYGTCFASGLASPAFSDPSVPAVGQSFFYLVTGVHAGVEWILGTDSSGNIRPNTTPCP